MRLGIVTNELFDPELGRIGGFGWATREVASLLVARPELGIQPVVLSPQRWAAAPQRVGGAPLRHQDGSRLSLVRAVRRERLDLLLTIDYRPNYRPVLLARPWAPLVVWARDPRTPEDARRIASIRGPEDDDASNGVASIDCTSLGPLVRGGRRLGRRVAVASPAPAYLARRAREAYALAGEPLRSLPNPIPAADPALARHATPAVLFLGRLDPYKRPWIVPELARRLPEVELWMAGEAHASGTSHWHPGALPCNVRLLGHVDGAEKERLLAAAWLLVNTSTHEGLAVSLLEALAHATPPVAFEDPDGVVSRFGVCVGRVDGAGLDGVPAMAEAIAALLADDTRREGLGRLGRDWVREVHTADAFVTALLGLAEDLGVG